MTLGGNGAFVTETGWDYPTGWGAPIVSGLMLTLTNRLTPLEGGGGGTSSNKAEGHTGHVRDHVQICCSSPHGWVGA